ncbi:hypothetical protein FHS19_003503 [Paenibacillus rhizosphaerae]|uniref:Uncharacterized protein n=1 Tax=Paenibacillus rhizosphaerae TaxID=297318 RepID=A0A839TTT7_9BACL|nr:hypothetical protein [Paenibacillus rhizosphaerae]MBB3128828.1 hypothetical protein [Paenibacillus rhizosphaerae]
MPLKTSLPKNFLKHFREADSGCRLDTWDLISINRPMNEVCRIPFGRRASSCRQPEPGI